MLKHSIGLPSGMVRKYFFVFYSIVLFYAWQNRFIFSSAPIPRDFFIHRQLMQNMYWNMSMKMEKDMDQSITTGMNMNMSRDMDMGMDMNMGMDTDTWHGHGIINI
jgi:hypothetical protein